MSTANETMGDGSGRAPINPELFAKGLAALRIFFGVILFANGLSKLFNFTAVSIGPYKATLIDRGVARGILENEGHRTELPLIGRIANDLILPNWSLFQWVATFMEIGVGALLIIGLASRLAALADLGQQLFLAGLYFTSSRWMFEQPHEYVPLVILILIPAGRMWGLDGKLIRTRPHLGRWLF
jgi:uncharacterized membrane protein YphA (DoxX/SURF4 family)